MERRSDDLNDVDPILGKTVGKYEMVRLVGQGGMGRVYEAINPSIGKRVVVKMLSPEVAKNRDAAARFQREAQAASAAESPHIVEIFDSGFAEDGSPFIVMELLRGETLASLLKREGRLSHEETTRILVMVLRGLSKAHAAGIVHRDLKPDNIFLVDRDPDPPFAKVLDFGVSKVERTRTNTTLTREGTVLGTPCYMSPEQAQGEPNVDARSDLWSVGAILFECLSGRPPFEGATYEQIIVRICTTDPKPLAELVPEVPASLAETVERCLRRERDERVASASELLGLLGESVPSAPRVRKASMQPSSAQTPNVGTDSTIEAPGVLMGSALLGRTPGPNRKRYAIPIGLAALLGSGVFVALSLQGRDDPRPPGPSAASTADAVATAPTPTSEPRVSATPTSDVREVATATPTASAVATTVTPATQVLPAKIKSTATPTAQPTAQPTVQAATPTATPKGVAGDLQIQRQ